MIYSILMVDRITDLLLFFGRLLVVGAIGMKLRAISQQNHFYSNSALGMIIKSLFRCLLRCPGLLLL